MGPPLGIPAVIAQQLQDLKALAPEDQYIHYSAIENGIPLVVTFRVGLARRIHDAKETFHDFTYKRVHGAWKEWEIVIWDESTDRRKFASPRRYTMPSDNSFLLLGMTVARIYGQLETRDAYRRMWALLWDTVETATGQTVKFKPFSGDSSGIRAILVDGNKEQIEACGDDLVKRNNPDISGLNISDPQEIVKYLIKLCMVHFDRYAIDFSWYASGYTQCSTTAYRNVDKLASKVPADAIRRVRQAPFLRSMQELDEFKHFCETSSYKALRGTSFRNILA